MGQAMAPPSLQRLSTTGRDDWVAQPLGDVVHVQQPQPNSDWQRPKVLSTDFQSHELAKFGPTMPWTIALLREAHPTPSLEVPGAVRTVSAAVFAVCAVSLGLWRMSGLFFISPLFSFFGCLAAILMFAISLRTEREWRNGA
jgi:hypothetical protein